MGEMDDLEKLRAELEQKEAEVKRLRREIKKAKAPSRGTHRNGEEAEGNSSRAAFPAHDNSIVNIDDFRAHAKKRAWGEDRPTNYFRDCIDRPRPCPWVGCKYHLLVDVTHGGNLAVNAGPKSTRGSRTKQRLPAKQVAEELVIDALYDSLRDGWPPTCALDVAEQPKEATLEEVAAIYNVSRERVRQLQAYALEVLREAPAQKIFKAWRGELGPGKPSESRERKYSVQKRRGSADAAD